MFHVKHYYIISRYLLIKYIDNFYYFKSNNAIINNHFIKIINMFSIIDNQIIILNHFVL